MWNNNQKPYALQFGVYGKTNTEHKTYWKPKQLLDEKTGDSIDTQQIIMDNLKTRRNEPYPTGSKISRMLCCKINFYKINMKSNYSSWAISVNLSKFV